MNNKTLRLPLIVRPSNRDETTNFDARIVNGYVEHVSKDESWVYKRGGFNVYQTIASNPSQGLGCYNWNGVIYSIFGGTFYGATTPIGTVDANAVYSFSLSLGITPKLVFQNGFSGYTYDPVNGLVQIKPLTTVTFTGNITNGSNTISSVSSTVGLSNLLSLSGQGITPGTTISSFTSNTVVMSAPATETIAHNSINADIWVTGTVTSGSPIVTSVSSVTNLSVGMAVYQITSGSSDIPELTTIVSIDSSTQFTMSAPSTGSGSISIQAISNFPNNKVPGIAYLDGYTNVMTLYAQIWSSGINNPNSWPDGDYLLAQIEPENAVYLAKQGLYIIAFKQYSVEVFYDAANTVGSPLGPVQGAKLDVGCWSANGVAEAEGILFWPSQTKDGGVMVHAMKELKAEQISTTAIDRLLQLVQFPGMVYSWTARLDGHLFYCLTLINSGLSLVYDWTSRQWYQWELSGEYLPYVSSTFNSIGQTVLQHSINGNLYSFESRGTYMDNGTPIEVDIYTPNFDGGTRFNKFIFSFELIADQTNGSVAQVRRSEDDYQTWSNFRTIDLSHRRARITDCGTFRRAAWHIKHACNTPLRIQSAEMMIEEGTL